MMSDEEVKQEILDKITNLKNTPNEWSTRDTLKNFTNFDFWRGDEMAIIDIDISIDIANQLYDYDDSLIPRDPNLDEIYDYLIK